MTGAYRLGRSRAWQDEKMACGWQPTLLLREGKERERSWDEASSTVLQPAQPRAWHHKESEP